jgi:hypothetical protein
MKYHQTNKEKNDHRITVLNNIKDKYNYGDMEFPADYDSIYNFEELNKVCIYIYTIGDDKDIIIDKPGKTEYIIK